MISLRTLTLYIHILVVVRKIKCANILILHPLYAGSHELTLRSIGNHLVKERGHNVTQIMFRHTNMNVSLSSSTDNLVNVIPLRIRDTKNECQRYINEDGEFDIGSFGTKLLWNYGDRPWQLPTDLFCVTRVHCNMVLNDPIFIESLNASNYDIGIYNISLYLGFVLIFDILQSHVVSSSNMKYVFIILFQYVYLIWLLFIAIIFILFTLILIVVMSFLYVYMATIIYSNMMSKEFYRLVLVG